ncbi:glyoxalase, partial [Nostoc linckia z16]
GMKADGVKIDENRMEDEIGKFAWVFDPEGNKIELWEPAADKK